MPRFSQRFSASYVTGSHNFKAGFQFEESYLELEHENGTHNVEYAFNNQVPVSLTQWATPYGLKAQNKDFGFYVQDQWTLQRLTLTYGVRYEYFNGYVPAAARGRDTQRVGARAQLRRGEERPAVEGRRSARRRRLRPLRQRPDRAEGRARPVRRRRPAIGITQNNNPIQTSINSVSRTWNDSFYPVGDPRRGNYVPDCDLANRGGNGECAAMANQNFGGLNATTRYADDALLGYGARSYNWDFTTEVQHELRPGVSMTAGYYRNWFGNHLVTDNILVTPADFSPFCITAPQRFAPARRRRLSGLRPVRRHTGEVRPGQQRDSAVRQLRKAAARQRLLQRHA